MDFLIYLLIVCDPYFSDQLQLYLMILISFCMKIIFGHGLSVSIVQMAPGEMAAQNKWLIKFSENGFD